MRLGMMVTLSLAVLLSSGCMKKKVSGLLPQSNLQNPLSPDATCPAGLRVSIVPQPRDDRFDSDGIPIFNPGARVSFRVTASGCVNGYGVGVGPTGGGTAQQFEVVKEIIVRLPSTPVDDEVMSFWISAYDRSRVSIARGPYEFESEPFHIRAAEVTPAVVNVSPASAAPVTNGFAEFSLWASQKIKITNFTSSITNYVDLTSVAPVPAIGSDVNAFTNVAFKLKVNSPASGQSSGTLTINYKEYDSLNQLGVERSLQINTSHPAAAGPNCSQTFYNDFLGLNANQALTYNCANGTLSLLVGFSTYPSTFSIPQDQQLKDLMHGKIDSDARADILFYSQKAGKGYFFYGKSKEAQSGAVFNVVPCGELDAATLGAALPSIFELTPKTSSRRAVITDVLSGSRKEREISVSEDGNTCAIVAPQPPAPASVTLGEPDTALVNGSVEALFTWSGSNVSNCLLRKCNPPSGSVFCAADSDYVTHVTLGGSSAPGSSVRVTNLTSSTAFHIKCEGNVKSPERFVHVVPPPPLNVCPITNLRLENSLSSAAAGVRHELQLGSIHLPNDVSNLDLRVNSITVDDYNPEMLVGGISAKRWAHGVHGQFVINGLNDQIASSLSAGSNAISCKMDNWRPSSGRANPIGCGFTLNGSYKTSGSCIADLKVAPVVGQIEKIEGKVLKGWACQMGNSNSINVHLYAGGPAGAPGSTYLGPFTANAASGDPVRRFCGSSGTRHRFEINLRGFSAAHSGKTIYVHGIHPSGNGGLNNYISGSGFQVIPR